MKKTIVLLFIFLSSCSTAKSDCETRFENSKYLISADNKKVVIFDNDKNCLGVFYENKSKFIAFPELERISDIDPKVDFSISNNSKFVLMQFDAGENEHLVRIYSLGTLDLIMEKQATVATWAENKVILVPTYNIEDLPKPNGLIVYNPDSNSSSTIAKKFAFTGNISAGTSFVIGDILFEKNGNYFSKPVVFDVNTGKQKADFVFN